MAYNRKDFFFKKAKEENYAARSIFKLEEIDKKYKLIKSGDQVLDLGAAPGSWSQFVSRKVGPKGKILGIDLREVEVTLPNAVFIRGDMLEADFTPTLQEYGFREGFNVVISDMAPNTTGIKFTDQARSLELCEMALNVAERYLVPGGHFVCKFFHGDGFEEFRKRLRSKFEKIEAIRPESTRKESKEIFFIGIKYKP